MKRLLSLLLALVLVFSLVACSDKGTETKGETKTETAGETGKETVKEAETSAAIEKIALGTSVSLGSSKDSTAQQDVTIAALALDAEGKIVKAHIDVAQSKFKVKEDGTFEVAPESTEFKTKHELKDDYGMKKASGIEKEWFEQAKGFEDYIIGKTIDEVVAIATKPSEDGSHPNVPAEADLLATTTIDIGAFQKAVADAANHTKDAKGATSLGLAVKTALGHGTAPAQDGKGANVQFESNISVTALDKDGKVVASLIDTAQNAVPFGEDHKVSSELKAEGTTKKKLGAEYGMKETSAKIGKIKDGGEWFEQVEGLENHLVGKTKDEVSSIELKDGAPAEGTDLVATTTIAITDLQEATVKSFDNVK
ncbi:hypothetical protein [uncultured Helcococcus sp.]|uniref:hypothetical protein n=1 Tax=uncultured Helcococcus sp. TaxID=1072508 RepID=UPI00260D9284|nr:hypothetical protein [uncultured Helcococcus sp.]